MEQLHARGVAVLGVDFDQEQVRILRHRKQQVRFGDAEDSAFLETLPLVSAAWVVTTLPDWTVNQSLLHVLAEVGYKGEIVGLVRNNMHEQALRKAGVVHVINPLNDAADHAAETLASKIELMRKKL
jgi:Trk K+ transport system NAD-binding subunit